jgi:transposase-like protein
MIRYFTALCNTLLKNNSDEQIFHDATKAFKHLDATCPHCGAIGNLSPHGKSERSLVSLEDNRIIDRRINPPRFKCDSCKVTHVLLPDIIVPHSPYSLQFKLLALDAYYSRETTVEVVCGRLGIAIATLYAWKRKFKLHKELHLGVLLSPKIPAASFLRETLGSSCISMTLRAFFRRFAFSFLQGPPSSTSRSIPP